MIKWMIWSLLLLAHSAYGMDNSVLALQQDVAQLQRQVGRLELEIESLKTQYEGLVKKVKTMAHPTHTSITAESIKEQMDSLRQELKTQAEQDKKDLLQQLSKKIDQWAAPSSSKAEPTQKTTFENDYPKEGIVYTVKPGDTLSKIAQENGSTVRDIQNANQIANPKNIQVGQSLFIPQK